MALRLRPCYPCCLAVLLLVASPADSVRSQSLGGATPETSRLQRLVNDFAWQLQTSYRGQAVEHSRRYDQLSAALAAWNASSRSSSDAERMEAWLRRAIHASMPGASSELPDPPDFSQPAVPKNTVAGEVRELPAPAGVEASRGVNPAEAPVAGPEARESDPFRFEINERGDNPLTASQPAPAVAEEPASDESVVAQELDGLALSRHPAASDLAWGNPFADDPLPPATEAVYETRRKPAMGPVRTVSINTSELQARLLGYRRGLDFVEAELIAEPEASAFRLAGLARELDSLASERGLLELYLAGLAAGERAAMGDLSSTGPVVERLRQRVEGRSQQLSAASGRSADAERAVLGGLERKLQQSTIE